MIDPGVVLDYTEAGVGVGSDNIVWVGMDPGGVVLTIIVSISLSFIFSTAPVCRQFLGTCGWF